MYSSGDVSLSSSADIRGHKLYFTNLVLCDVGRNRLLNLMKTSGFTFYEIIVYYIILRICAFYLCLNLNDRLRFRGNDSGRECYIVANSITLQCNIVRVKASSHVTCTTHGAEQRLLPHV